MYYFNTLITCIRLELPSILSVSRQLHLNLSLKKKAQMTNCQNVMSKRTIIFGEA